MKKIIVAIGLSLVSFGSLFSQTKIYNLPTNIGTTWDWLPTTQGLNTVKINPSSLWLGIPFAIKDEGINVVGSGATSINFTGAGVTTTQISNAVTVNIPAASGGGASAVTTTYATQTANYTLADYTATDGTCQNFVITGNSTNTIAVPSLNAPDGRQKWKNTSGVSFNNTKKNYAYTCAIDGHIHYNVALEELPTVDVTAPLITSASTNSAGTIITLTYNEALGAIIPATSSFSTSPAKTISSVSVIGSTVQVTVTPAFVNGNVITANYTGGTNKIQDATGNIAVNLTAYSITNNVPGVDNTLPTFTTNSVGTITNTTAVYNVQISESSTVKWMVTTSAVVPTKPAILAGTGAVVFGSVTMTGTTSNTASLTGLAASTLYYLYSYAIDLAANESPIQASVSFTTISAAFSTTSLSLSAVNQIASTTTNPTNLSFGNGGTDQVFSISGFAKYTSTGAEQRFVGFTGTSGVADFSYNLGVYGNASNSMIFLIYDGGNSNRIGVLTSSPVPLNAWFHYTATYDASETIAGMKIYINGALQATSTASSGAYLGMPASNSNMKVSIGGQPVTGSFAYANSTLLDELAIWNKELTASEVTNIYNAGVPMNLATSSPNANLKSWWRWENNMNDSGSNAYNLTGIATPNYSTDKP